MRTKAPGSARPGGKQPFECLPHATKRPQLARLDHAKRTGPEIAYLHGTGVKIPRGNRHERETVVRKAAGRRASSCLAKGENSPCGKRNSGTGAGMGSPSAGSGSDSSAIQAKSELCVGVRA